MRGEVYSPSASIHILTNSIVSTVGAEAKIHGYQESNNRNHKVWDVGELGVSHVVVVSVAQRLNWFTDKYPADRQRCALAQGSKVAVPHVLVVSVKRI